jgi:hypothetical protein
MILCVFANIPGSGGNDLIGSRHWLRRYRAHGAAEMLVRNCRNVPFRRQNLQAGAVFRGGFGSILMPGGCFMGGTLSGRTGSLLDAGSLTRGAGGVASGGNRLFRGFRRVVACLPGRLFVPAGLCAYLFARQAGLRDLAGGGLVRGLVGLPASR